MTDGHESSQSFNGTPIPYEYPISTATWLTCGRCGCLYQEGNVHYCPGALEPDPDHYNITWPPEPSNHDLKRQLDRIEGMLKELLGR